MWPGSAIPSDLCKNFSLKQIIYLIKILNAESQSLKSYRLSYDKSICFRVLHHINIIIRILWDIRRDSFSVLRHNTLVNILGDFELRLILSNNSWLNCSRVHFKFGIADELPLQFHNTFCFDFSHLKLYILLNYVRYSLVNKNSIVRKPSFKCTMSRLQ